MWLCWGLQNWIYWPRNSEFYDFKYVFNKLISRMLHFRHFRIFGIIRHFPCSFQFYCSFVTCNQLELITLVMIFGAEMHMKELFTWRFMQGIWCIPHLLSIGYVSKIDDHVIEFALQVHFQAVRICTFGPKKWIKSRDHKFRW